MIKKIGDAIPSKSFSYLIICGGIIVIILLLGVFPFHRYNVNRSNEVKNTQAQIAEQKEFQKVYQLLQNIQKTERVHKLPNPEKTKLARMDLNKFQDVFQAEAKKSGLATIALVPDMKTIAAGSTSTLFNATTKGQFADFRQLLINLGALTYIDKIEEINIKQAADAMEFKMKIWIALAN
jgi:type II secretory pathway pseudopilin PulG